MVNVKIVEIREGSGSIMSDTLCNIASGALLTMAGQYLLRVWRLLILHVDDAEHQVLGRSVRLYLLVGNNGKTVARNAVAYLTTMVVKGSKRQAELPAELVPPKPRDVEKAWRYLVPEPVSKETNIGVCKENLPWATPKEFGHGLDGLPYCHVADIPAGGYNRVVLMDVYRIDLSGGERCYVLRVFSEYGTEATPESC